MSGNFFTEPPNLLLCWLNNKDRAGGYTIEECVRACAACHSGSGRKPKSYIRAQLQAFTSNQRKNDIEGQMRNISRQMTPEEITLSRLTIHSAKHDQKTALFKG